MILHPAAFEGTNAVVVGLAWMVDDDGENAPKESGIPLVHVNVVVSADDLTGSLMT